MTSPEPRRGDRVIYGHGSFLINDFDDDFGTRLSNGKWISASQLSSLDDGVWFYTIKDAEDMTVAELVHEHREGTRNVLKERIGVLIAAAILPEIGKLIENATLEAVDHVMRDVYRTPPRLMGHDTGEKP